MWNVTSSMADFLFNVSNVVLMIGALAVLVGTIGSIKMGAVREQFSNERISVNEAETARANAEALKAQLALVQFKTPRTLTPEQEGRISDKVRPFTGVSFDVAAANRKESLDLVLQIERALAAAGWKETGWTATVVITRTDKPSLGLAMEVGVSVQVEIPQEAKLLPAAKALAAALRDEGIAAEAQFMGVPQNNNHEAIHIVVGEKPQ